MRVGEVSARAKSRCATQASRGLRTEGLAEPATTGSSRYDPAWRFPKFQKSCALAQWYWAGTVNARTSAHTQ